MVISLDLYVVKFILSIYLFFYLLQCQWPRHGSEVLENTLLILRGRAIPPSSVGFASGHRGGYCPTPQDSEGIFQYLLAMPRPLSHFLASSSQKMNDFLQNAGILGVLKKRKSQIRELQEIPVLKLLFCVLMQG